ncbi:AMP-binding protein [Rhodococcus opacus]|uniref:class I adenylate-forming enzyme family protein n=1 Tax=Rhodococcus opacus TaxID=37919 RepID=UPI001FF6B173|nr:AMP-binding protein [Rhodococcus opacus]UOT02915.1 AMP-binding protein [Rhodococcus opacus]
MNSAAPVLHYPDLTLAAFPSGMADLYGDKAAVVDGDTVCTYRELDQRSGAFAAALRDAGVTERDVVLLHLGNCIEFVVAYYGALRAGATVTLVNPLQPGPGLRSQIVDTAAVAAVTQPAQLDTLTEAASGTTVRTIVVAGLPAGAGRGQFGFEEFVRGYATAPSTPKVSGDDVAHLAYTGGTTGLSKGVRVLHRNVLANVTQMIAWRAGHEVRATADGGIELRPVESLGDRGVVPGAGATVVVSPLFHAHALINMSFLLLCGATQVFAGRFEPGRMLELIETHRATYITGSPAMWHAVATHPDAATRDTDSVRVVSSGAAPIDHVTLEALGRAFPSASVVEGYGLTEGTCLVASAPLTGSVAYKLGSVGLPVFDTEVQIRAQDDSGAVLEAGTRGKLWVRGPQVTDGYLNHPEITAQQYVDGWLDTGDIAYLDEDGYLFICDRTKDMLIYKGYNVYPRELEEILVSHPDVSSAAVVGREAGSVGQEPVAFVVPMPDVTIDPDAVSAFVAERVLPYKKVRDVVVVEQLPTSAAGKILKTKLREQLAAATT